MNILTPEARRVIDKTERFRCYQAAVRSENHPMIHREMLALAAKLRLAGHIKTEK